MNEPAPSPRPTPPDRCDDTRATGDHAADRVAEAAWRARDVGRSLEHCEALTAHVKQGHRRIASVKVRYLAYARADGG
jgi:hypothetical protein